MDQSDESLVKELEDAIEAITGQLTEFDTLLEQDPENEDIIQLKQELSASLADLKAQLATYKPTIAAAADSPRNEAELQNPPSAIAKSSISQSHLRPRATTGKMHPENIYCTQEPDFTALAARFPYLQPHVTLLPTGRGALDFTSWDATCQLTRALLEADYQVRWSLPEGQLVPPLPNRLNYIHWLHNLLQLSSPAGPVRGLDIGCGANYIYCLLGAAVYGWHMVGVDVTDVALAAATANRQANLKLQHLLAVRRSAVAAAGGAAADSGAVRKVEGVLLPAMASASEAFHFCMCNPPFFTSSKEANQNPGTACGGTAEEMVCEGGELAFVQQMIRESQVLGPKIHWYTSMLGKKATLKQLRKELHGLGVTALRTTELVQGRTSRWAIAWSFSVDPKLASQPLPQTQPAPATAGATTSTAPAHSSGNPDDGGGVGGMPESATCLAETAAAPPAAAAAVLGSLPSDVRLVRRMVWGVAAPLAEGGKLMSATAALLGSYGAKCKVDAAAWMVEASLGFPGGGAAAAKPPGAAAAGDGAAGAAAGREGGSEGAPLKKKARLASGGEAVGDAGVLVRLKFVQQQSRKFAVTAAIANTCGELEARLFMGTMVRLKDDLSLMWDID